MKGDIINYEILLEQYIVLSQVSNVIQSDVVLQ